MHVARFAQIGGHFSHFRVELNVDLFSFAKDNGMFQMEMDENDHFIVARLIECMANIGIENIDLIAPHRRVTKSVRMSFQRAVDLLVGETGTNVEVLQFRIDFTRIEN